MITRIFARTLTSLPVKLLLLLGVALAAATVAVPQLVDSKPLVSALAAHIQKTSGGTLLVKGGSQIQVLPRPALLLQGAEITQPETPRSPSINIDSAELSVDIIAMLSGTPRVNALRMSGVSVVAEKSPAGDADWGFLGGPLIKTLLAIKPDHPLYVSVASGRVTVADGKTGETYGITNMAMAGELGENSRLDGMVTYQDMNLQFSATRNGLVGATPITLQLSGNGASMSLKGSMDFTSDYPVVVGKIEVSAADISSYLAEAPPPEKPHASPLKLTADYAQREGLIQLSNISLDALNSVGTGKFDWVTSPQSQYRMSLHFTTLDLPGVRQLANVYLDSLNQQEERRAPKTLVDIALNMGLDITADKVTNGQKTWSRAGFDGTLSDGVLTVNKLSFLLPGESTLALFGVLSMSDTQGLRFEGSSEAEGKSLRELLTVLDDSAGSLPSSGFGAYRIRSNLFISKELLRLSEADVKFSELALKGGLVVYYDKKPRVEADVGLRDINFDYFRDSWRSNTLENTSSDKSSDMLQVNRNIDFDWLKKLTGTIDFKVDVQGFTFLERKGKNASFRLFAQSGEIGIYNARFVYDADTTEASLKLDVSKDRPALNVVLNTSEINTNYFALTPSPPEPIVPEPKEAAPSQEIIPELAMPAATTPEEELRQKIAEEAAQMQPGAPPAPAPETALPPQSPPENPAGALVPPVPEIPPVPADDETSTPVELTPLIEDKGAWNLLRSVFIREALAQENSIVMPASTAPEGLSAAPPANMDMIANDDIKRLAGMPIELEFLEGIGGTFDISIGKLQHKNLLFQNFKMLAKLERNLLTFQTLTFAHWGGSFSINGTLFGGRVPGISLGFIIASVDIGQMLGTLLRIDSIHGRASISGTIDTSGINILSWISQATGKLLVAGRGVNIRGFDMAGVSNAVSVSRTAADVFNNVNLAVVGGSGDYSADGAINIQKGSIIIPGIALKTGRVVGTVGGDFRLLPWDINLSGTFKFPDLSTENVPTMTVRWSGPVGDPSLQTDTQALEAFVSKRITGN
ncbi:MAG: AsmA-like C-terminal region-containing protein [Alphaproteobacteria bacterium]|nr:AsmA-like C-terminal region-containing protein [Alphaproteobacteria bacterium]